MKTLLRLLLSLVVLPVLFVVVLLGHKAMASGAVSPMTDTEKQNAPSRIVTLDNDGNPGFNADCKFYSSAHIQCAFFRNPDNAATQISVLSGDNREYWFNPELTEKSGHPVFSDKDDAEGWGYFHFAATGGKVFLNGVLNNHQDNGNTGAKINDISNYDKAIDDGDDGDGVCSVTKAENGCHFDRHKDQKPTFNAEKVKDINQKAIEGQQSAQDCAKDSGSLGFIICPIYDWVNNSIGDMIGISNASTNGGDHAASNGLLIDLMTVPPLSTTYSGGENGIYKAWSGMKDLALGLYVLIFIVAIFANSLSLGIDNYTLKKTLPRLIAGAILTQFSFLIVGVLVDVSNLVGTAIPSWILGAANIGGFDFAFQSSLAGTSYATLGILMLLILAILALVSLLIAVFVFLARQLIIFALVIAAPFAFLLWILPNTENMYKKWWDNFIRVLMMYPIATGIVALALLFSNTVGKTDASDALKVFAGLIPMIALVMLPKTFKWGGQAFAAVAGAVQNRAAGMQKAAGALPGKVAKGAGKKVMSSDTASRLGTSMASSRLGRTFGAGALNKKTQAEKSAAIANANKLVENMDANQLMKVAKSGNQYEAAAAIGQLAKKGDRKKLNELAAMGGKTAKAYNDASSRHFSDWSDKNIDLRRTGGTYTDMSKLSDDALAKMDPDALMFNHKAGRVSDEQINSLRANTRVHGQMGSQMKADLGLAGGVDSRSKTEVTEVLGPQLITRVVDGEMKERLGPDTKTFGTTEYHTDDAGTPTHRPIYKVDQGVSVEKQVIKPGEGLVTRPTPPTGP